jgi:hypothetical protein
MNTATDLPLWSTPERTGLPGRSPVARASTCWPREPNAVGLYPYIHRKIGGRGVRQRFLAPRSQMLQTASSVFTLSRLAKELPIFLEDGVAWRKVNGARRDLGDNCEFLPYLL